jgi:predicted porin
LAYDSWGTTGAATAGKDLGRRNRLSDDSSRIGFRINEDLGGGLRAFSVIETGIALDTASNLGQSGVANSGAGYIGTREAHVGIGNADAEIRLGRQNVFWGNGRIEDVSANGVHGGVISSYTAPSSGYTSGPAARQDNAVKFVANKGLFGAFAGSELWFADGQLGEQAAADKQAKAKVQGLTIKYETGPWAAQYDTATSKNTNNGSDTASAYTMSATSGTIAQVGAPTLDSTVKGTKIGLAYFYAPTSKVYFINAKFSTAYTTAAENDTAPVNIAATATSTAYNKGFREQSSNSFGIQHAFAGGLTGYVQYVTQGAAKDYTGASVADSGSKAYAFAVRKDLSKRTSLNASYNIIKNEAKNNINSSGGGQSSAAFIGAGADLKLIGVGIQHNF